MNKFLIADDHTVVRQGLVQILKEDFPKAEFTEASNGVDVIKLTRKKTFDLIILDINMPEMSGLEVLKQLKELTDTPVLVLSMHTEDQYAVRMLRSGASGYLTKETAPEELVKAVRKILAGRKYITETIAEKLALNLEFDHDQPLHEMLSDREFQVFTLIASGKTVSEIAENLNLGVPTVSTYRARILEKLHMKNNAELTRHAIKQGIV